MNELDKNLLTGESIIFATKKHWFSPIRASLIAALLIVGAIVLRALAPTGEGGLLSGLGGLMDLVANVAIIVAIGWIGYNIAAYLSAHFGVTNMRVLRYEGLIQRRSSETLLTSLSDVRLTEPAIGRMLGFGDLRILTSSGAAGEDEFKTVAEAGRLRTAIQEQKAAQAQPAPQPVVAAPAAEPPPPPTPAPAAAAPADPAARLEQLTALRDQGVITPEEFEAKRAEIIAQM